MSNEIFNDPEVQKGIENSIKDHLLNHDAREWSAVKESVSNAVEKGNISNQALRSIADGIKLNGGMFNYFVDHFGAKRIYPEL